MPERPITQTKILLHLQYPDLSKYWIIRQSPRIRKQSKMFLYPDIEGWGLLFIIATLQFANAEQNKMIFH